MSEVFITKTSPLQQLQRIEGSKGVSGSDQAPGNFSELLSDALGEVNKLQLDSGQEINRLMAGEVTDVHTAMIAMQKADISFQTMMQVRNKLVEAYQEVMRMGV